MDPVLGNGSNPQRLNRYGYVLNDPVNLVDPDGYDPKPHLCRPGEPCFDEEPRGTDFPPMPYVMNLPGNYYSFRIWEPQFADDFRGGVGAPDLSAWWKDLLSGVAFGISYPCLDALLAVGDTIPLPSPLQGMAVDLAAFSSAMSEDDGMNPGATAAIFTNLGLGILQNAGVAIAVGGGMPALGVVPIVAGTLGEAMTMNRMAASRYYSGDGLSVGWETFRTEISGRDVEAVAGYAFAGFVGTLGFTSWGNMILDKCGWSDHVKTGGPSRGR